ncbi:hypothetical protein LOZ80_36145 [Paenibacillus sp. HWE-109]|uniref:hypothetical protein n=1 Tax=Paenibacillus sp. HWE-109 TaxID=1306526 RepID=UPI001EDF2026|nr:hypothetical protein [Paenibacillus sp. HWE-109]UKS26834.1 hypothetical protein LOZ80_36145 [Paenibacillus sp. HWE-109]
MKFSLKAESGAKVWLVTLKNSVIGHAEVNRAESSRSESSRPSTAQPPNNQTATLTNCMMLKGKKLATLKN